MKNKVPSDNAPENPNILSRRDYQEILTAKLAGGDLHAYETLQKLRRVDRMLDRLRIASGEKPLYSQTVNDTV